MSEVLVERDGHVATLTLNRPERLNAISGPMLEPFSERARERAEDVGASSRVRQGHVHLLVEASGPQQRRIDEIRPVGGGEDGYADERLDAVQLAEQLVDDAVCGGRAACLRHGRLQPASARLAQGQRSLAAAHR